MNDELVFKKGILEQIRSGEMNEILTQKEKLMFAMQRNFWKELPDNEKTFKGIITRVK